MRQMIFMAMVVIVLSLMVGGITWLVLGDHPSSPMELRFEAIEQRVETLEGEYNEN